MYNPWAKGKNNGSLFKFDPKKTGLYTFRWNRPCTPQNEAELSPLTTHWPIIDNHLYTSITTADVKHYNKAMLRENTQCHVY